MSCFLSIIVNYNQKKLKEGKEDTRKSINNCSEKYGAVYSRSHHSKLLPGAERRNCGTACCGNGSNGDLHIYVCR